MRFSVRPLRLKQIQFLRRNHLPNTSYHHFSTGTTRLPPFYIKMANYKVCVAAFALGGAVRVKRGGQAEQAQKNLQSFLEEQKNAYTQEAVKDTLLYKYCTKPTVDPDEVESRDKNCEKDVTQFYSNDQEVVRAP